MTKDQLLEKINPIVEAKIVELSKHKTAAQMAYFGEGIRNLVSQLITLSELARVGIALEHSVVLPCKNEQGKSILNRDMREVYGLTTAYLAIGQAASSLMWEIDLRNTVVDAIEAYYGVSFSGLKVHKRITKAGEIAHISSRLYSINKQLGYTLFRQNGASDFITETELKEWETL